MDLLFDGASVSKLGTKFRLSMLQEMVALGHDVTVFAYVDIDQYKTLEGLGYNTRNIQGDYSFYNHITFEFLDLPRDSYDILFIEGGAQNVIFTRRVAWGKVSSQWFVYESICRHKGRVFWYFPEPIYGLRWEALEKPTDKPHKNRMNFREIWNSSSRFLKDKRFILLAPVNNFTELRKISQIPFHYPDEGLIYFPHRLSAPEICYPELPPLPQEELHFDLAYVGHLNGGEESYRRRILMNLLRGAEQSDLRIGIFGDNDSAQRMLPHDSRLRRCFYPRTSSQKEANEILHHSLTALFIQRRDFIRTGHEPTRHLQAAQCGALNLWHHESPWMEKYAPEMQVEDFGDIAMRIGDLRADDIVRLQILEGQRKRIGHYRHQLEAALALPGVAVEDVWQKELPPVYETPIPIPFPPEQ